MILINFSPVQNFIVKKATSILSNKLKTTVSIDNIRLDFLNHIKLQGVYVEDQNKDTLLYAGEVEGRITDWFFLKKGKPVIKYIGLKNAYANLYRTKKSDQWNYQFIVDAFEPKKKDTTKKKETDFNIDLEKVALEKVRFNMNDGWVGSDMSFNVGSFVINAKEVDLKKRIIDINKIEATKTIIVLREYEGGKPPTPKPENVSPKTIDTTAFNPENWAININKLLLEDCFFSLDANEQDGIPNEFDHSHMRVSDIQLDAKEVAIVGDTLTLKLNNLAAKERCGLIIKEFSSKITVSPNASICEDLILKTSNSTLQDHYAMYYTRFPDFNDYIYKVRMDARFQKSVINSKDIAYFAPALKEYPTILNIAGDIKGTVDNIQAKGLRLDDGINKISGDIIIKGLPDIDQAFFDYQNGHIITSNKGIFKYAPELKDNPSIAIDSIKSFEFKGSYKGSIYSFALNGNINSNLGNIVSDVSIQAPKTKERQSTYKGKMSASDFNIGALLREPLLGKVTLKADVDGTSFNIDDANINFNALIEYIDINGYRYTNIDADGLLEKKKFTGNLLVSDPNLALGFYGEFDFSKELLSINAKANLVSSNLTALKLINSNDTVNALADFDLNYTGTSIDNFNGYAKLYNIDIRRANERIDIDSVYLQASDSIYSKTITLNSNLVDAKVSGNYQLTKLAASVQYYISGYLPDYIKKPTKEAPEQNIKFEVHTKDLNELFAVISPGIRGFNNVEINGTLNTVKQSLVINGHIVEGIINNNKLRNVTIEGNGNFNTLNINVSAGEIVMGDSVISGALDLKTTLGNNKLDFSIVTTSPYDIGTASLKGQAIARNDTLSLALGQSEFYLNTLKWEIPAGNRTIISDKYININGLTIKSGLQQITVNSNNSGLNQIINLKISNLDIAQLGNIAGLGEYEPDGRINGEVRIENPFTEIYAYTDIKASNVKLGAEDVGDINIVGNYSSKKNLFSLDKKTGIYNKDAYLSIYGLLSLDSTNRQNIDGAIEMYNTPISWISPFVKGNISDMSGELNGKVQIKGTSTQPQIIGDIKLNEIAMRVDMLGTYYKIANAAIHLNNKEISLGKVNLTDRFDNKATLSGSIYHDLFKDMRFNLRMQSSKLEVINLTEAEGDAFYGNFIAGFSSMTVTGPINNINMRLLGVTPAEKSHLYLPLSSGNGLSSYNYISFKTYGKDQELTKKETNRLNLHIVANLNPLGEVTMVMDPSTGDAINAKGTGTVTIDMPANSEFKMYGNYVIDEGAYTFTLKQLFLKRRFILDKGSIITFNGPINNTALNVEGVYKTRARLYDLLTENEKESLAYANKTEVDAAKMMQDINVLLYMKGTLAEPNLSFKIERADKSGSSPVVEAKLNAVNQNDQELLNQVASLLLLNTFTTKGETIGGGAASGALSNVGDILSSTASSQLTNVVGKLTGDQDLAINVKYRNYTYSDAYNNVNATNRNEVKFGVQKNYFDNRLNVEVGSALDWGKPSSSNNSDNFNFVGDFRVQYLLKEGGNLRANIFRTGNYDAVIGGNVSKGGFGLSWRKSFDNFGDLFRGSKYINRKEEEDQKVEQDK